MESVGLLQFDSLGFDRTSTANRDAIQCAGDPQSDQSQHEQAQCGSNMSGRASILKNSSSKSLDSLGCQRGTRTSCYVVESESPTEKHGEHKQQAETSLMSEADAANSERPYGKSNLFPFLKLAASSSYDDGDTHCGGSAIDLELLYVLPLDDCAQSEFECRSYSSVSATPLPTLNIQRMKAQKSNTQSKATEDCSSADSHSADSSQTSLTPEGEVTRSTDLIQRNGSVGITKGHSKFRLFLKRSRIRMEQGKSQGLKLFASLPVVFGCKSAIRNQVIESASEEDTKKISTAVAHQRPEEEKTIASSSTRSYPIEVTLVHSHRRLRWEDEIENDRALQVDSVIENTSTRLAQLGSPPLLPGSPVVEKRMRVRNLATNSIPLEERRQLEESILRVLSQSSRLAIAEMKKSSSVSSEEYDEDDDSIEAARTSGRLPTNDETLYHDSKARTTMLGNDSSHSQADAVIPNRVEPPTTPATTNNMRDERNNFTSFKTIVESKRDPVPNEEELISEIKITGIISLEDGHESLLSEDECDPAEGKEGVLLKPEENKEEDESVEAVIRGVRTVESMMSDLSEPPNIVESLNHVEAETQVPRSFSKATPPHSPKYHQGGWRPSFDWVATDIFCTCDSEEPATVSADIIAAAVAAAAAAENQQVDKCISFRARSERMRMIHADHICMDSCFDTCTSPDTSDGEDDESGILTATDNDEKNIDDSERDSSVQFSDTGSSFVSSSFVSSSVVS